MCKGLNGVKEAMTEAININKNIFNSEQIFAIQNIVKKEIEEMYDIKELNYASLSEETKKNIEAGKKEFLEGKTKSFEEVYEKCMK